MKPEPVSIDKLKPPAPMPQQAEAPHKVMLKLTDDEIVFEVQNGEHAARFLDSIQAILTEKPPVARIAIGPEIYAIPTDKIMYAKLCRR